MTINESRLYEHLTRCPNTLYLTDIDYALTNRPIYGGIRRGEGGTKQEQEARLEAHERFLAKARMADYRCSELFNALCRHGLSIDLAEDIAQKVWEIPLNYFTRDYARRKPQWDAFMRGVN